MLRVSRDGVGVGCSAARPGAAQAAAAVSARASAWYVNDSSFVDSATAQRTPPAGRRTTPAGLAAAELDAHRKPPDSRALAGLTAATGVRELRPPRPLRGSVSAARACRNEFPWPFRTWCDAQRRAPRARRPSRWPSC